MEKSGFCFIPRKALVATVSTRTTCEDLVFIYFWLYIIALLWCGGIYLLYCHGLASLVPFVLSITANQYKVLLTDYLMMKYFCPYGCGLFQYGSAPLAIMARVDE